MAELLLELFSEEIPARMQIRAADDLKRLVCDGLNKRGLSFSNSKAFATPRRLTLVVNGIPEHTEDQTLEKRGPRVGAADQAIQGFLKATGLDSLEQAEQRDTGKGVFWFAVQRVAGAPAMPSVVGAIEDSLEAMPWPRVLLIRPSKRGFFLDRFTADGEAAGDTWHQDLDEGKEQALDEFDGSLGAWQELPPELGDGDALAIALKSQQTQ